MISQSSMESNTSASPGDHPGAGDIPFVWEDRIGTGSSYSWHINRRSRRRQQDRLVPDPDGPIDGQFRQGGEPVGAAFHREGRREDPGSARGPLETPGGGGGQFGESARLRVGGAGRSQGRLDEGFDDGAQRRFQLPQQPEQVGGPGVQG